MKLSLIRAVASCKTAPGVSQITSVACVQYATCVQYTERGAR